jgi:hypothetical protein
MWTVNILSRYLPRLARRIELDGFLKLSVLKNDQRSVIVSVPVISTKDLSRLVFAADRHQPARGLKLFVSTLRYFKANGQRKVTSGMKYTKKRTMAAGII